MRSMVVFLALVGFACAGLHQGLPLEERLRAYEGNPRAFEGVIKSAAECIRELLLSSSMDPLKIDDLTLNLDTLGLGLVSGKVNLKNFVLNGIASFELTKVKGNIIIIPPGTKLEVDFQWPSLDFSGEYDIDASALGHTVKGAGKITHKATEFGLEVTVKANLIRISVKNLELKPFIKTFEIHLDELLIDGVDKAPIISEKASMIPALVEKHGDEVGAKIAAVLKQVINNILSKKSDSSFGDSLKACLKF